MSRLIALVMLILLGALGFQATRAYDPGWLLVASALLAGIPTMLALTQTVPDAVRLGHRADSPPEQTRLARSICSRVMPSAWVTDQRSGRIGRTLSACS